LTRGIGVRDNALTDRLFAAVDAAVSCSAAAISGLTLLAVAKDATIVDEGERL
jgi:hypothetical protein